MSFKRYYQSVIIMKKKTVSSTICIFTSKILYDKLILVLEKKDKKIVKKPITTRLTQKRVCVNIVKVGG